MENSVYKFDRRVVYDMDVTDYTSVYYGKMKEIFKNYPDFFMSYEATTDDKVENIAYKLYGSENYADVILAVNSSVFIWSASYNNDVLEEKNTSLLSLLKLELNVTEGEKIETLYANISEKSDSSNSSKKIITVPKPDKLNSLLSLINTYRNKNTVKDITEVVDE